MSFLYMLVLKTQFCCELSSFWKVVTTSLAYLITSHRRQEMHSSVWS